MKKIEGAGKQKIEKGQKYSKQNRNKYIKKRLPLLSHQV